MSVFKMPVPVTITGRSSSITNAFVSGIIPCIEPTEQEIDKALQVLGMTQETICCAYCGDSHTEWDHLNPLVVNKTPTGYISEINNLVPACNKCNQSKGNKKWQEWIVGDADRSPKTRGIPDLQERIERLERYEEIFKPMRIDFREIVGNELWDEHWHNYEAVISAMEDARDTSNRVKQIIAQAVTGKAECQRSKRRGTTGRSHSRQLMDSDTNFDIESILKSIGKWFYLRNFELIYEWQGEKNDLVDKLLERPNGKGRTGTNTSVSEALRLRDMGATDEALDILLKSDRLLRDHPEASEMIHEIRARHPELNSLSLTK